MRVLRGCKFKLKTTPELQQKFAVMAGHARFVWNKALRLNLDRLERKIPIMWYGDLCGPPSLEAVRRMRIPVFCWRKGSRAVCGGKSDTFAWCWSNWRK